MILSLDAPTIAIAWLALLAAVFSVHPGWPVVVASVLVTYHSRRELLPAPAL